VRHHVVDLIGLLGTLTRADRAGQAERGVGGVDHLEDHQQVAARLALGLGAQLGALGDPGVADLAAAAVVDQHADGVLLVAVGEGHGQRLLAAADVGVVPAVTDPRSADLAGPRRVSHVTGVKPRGRLPGGRAQGGRADRGEDAQQGEGLRGGRRLGGGHQRPGEGAHQRGLARGRRGQGADQVGSPELGVHRVLQLAQDLVGLGQHPGEGLLDRDRREEAGDVGLPGVVGIHAEQDRRAG
jgi:hypothetical protein